jgi:serine/threonine-protein kinase RsbT
LALAAGLPAQRAEELAIVVSELVTNAVKYAGGGDLVVRALLTGGAEAGVEVIMSDRGPGIADLDAALVDGYSQGRQRDPGAMPAASLGAGLGAVRRLCDEVEFGPRPAGAGLVVRAIKYVHPKLHTKGSSTRVL